MQSNEASSSSSILEPRRRKKKGISDAIVKFGTMMANIALGIDIRSFQSNNDNSQERLSRQNSQDFDYFVGPVSDNKNATYHGYTKHSNRTSINYDFRAAQAQSRRKSSSTSCESENILRTSPYCDGENCERFIGDSNTSMTRDQSPSNFRKIHRRNSSNSSSINPSFSYEDDFYDDNGNLHQQKISQFNSSTIQARRPTTLDLQGHRRQLHHQYGASTSATPTSTQSSPDTHFDLSSPVVPHQRTVRFNFSNADEINMNYPVNHSRTLIDTPSDGQLMDGTRPLTATSQKSKKCMLSNKKNQFDEVSKM